MTSASSRRSATSRRTTSRLGIRRSKAKRSSFSASSSGRRTNRAAVSSARRLRCLAMPTTIAQGYQDIQDPVRSSGLPPLHGRYLGHTTLTVPMRVLIAEDEPRLAEALARGLRRNGFAVDVALDGNQALQAHLGRRLRRRRPRPRPALRPRRRGLPPARGRRAPAADPHAHRRRRRARRASRGSTSAPTTTSPSRSPSPRSSRACTRCSAATRSPRSPCSSAPACAWTPRATRSRATARRSR